MSRAVLTIATGKPIYHAMATALARSFLLWNEGNGIRFILATDAPDRIPADLRHRVDLRALGENEVAAGFTAKLSIDRMSDADATLFIDSDCLCVRSLEPVFDAFRGRPVATVGTRITEGECWGDVAAICERTTIEALPRFVGAIYYFERGPEATAVFEDARRLEADYDAIGLRTLRGKKNEEPLIAIAMARHQLFPIEDDGSIKADLMFARTARINVTSGKAIMDVELPWKAIDGATPAIVHFNCTFADTPMYKRQVLALEASRHGRWMSGAVHGVSRVLLELPHEVWSVFKDAFRPLYHRLFGTRAVKPSRRL